MKTATRLSTTELLEQINMFLPSWGGYKVRKYERGGITFYDTILECDFFHYEPLKIRTTSTDMLHSMTQALNLLKLWAYGN